MIPITPALEFAKRARRFLIRHHTPVFEILTYEEFQQEFYYTLHFQDILVVMKYDRDGHHAITKVTKCQASTIVKDSHVCIFDIQDTVERHRHFRHMAIQQARQ